MNFEEKYNELVKRYEAWDKSYAPHPMTVMALFYEYTDGELEFEVFEIVSEWGLYYFNLDGSFNEYEHQTWQDYD